MNEIQSTTIDGDPTAPQPQGVINAKSTADAYDYVRPERHWRDPVSVRLSRQIAHRAPVEVCGHVPSGLPPPGTGESLSSAGGQATGRAALGGFAQCHGLSRTRLKM